MCPKARRIFHRGITMGLEVYYKAFVGYDAGFFDPIHPLPDIDVDVAAPVSDGEEVVFNDRLVGNVPGMDSNVPEVGHRVV